MIFGAYYAFSIKVIFSNSILAHNVMAKVVLDKEAVLELKCYSKPFKKHIILLYKDSEKTLQESYLHT